MEENNHYDYIDTDDEAPAKRLKRKDFDIKAFEINDGRSNLKKNVQESNLGKKPFDEDYLMFLKSLLLESEPSSSDKSDDDSDMEDTDPQYRMFLKNLKVGRRSYKLVMTKKNRMVTVMYEGEDDSDDDYGMQSMVKLKSLQKENQNIGNDRRRARDNVTKKTHLKSVAAKYKENNQSRGKIGTHSRLEMCNNVMESEKKIGIEKVKETYDFVDGDLKLKDLKNLPRRLKMDTHKSLRSGGHKHVESIKMDMENNRGREKRKRVEKILKSKHANCDQTKTREIKKKRTKRNSVFGCDWQQELNADDMDDCYRDFLNGVEIEGDCFVYKGKGQKPVNLEAFDVESSSDSEIFMTSNASDFNEGGCNPFQTTKLFVAPENQQLCPVSDSVFRKKLMAKLGEPYDDEEYKKLWDLFHEEKPKLNHKDLRGPGAMKSFPVDELSPSFCDIYAPLWKKISAVRHERHKKLFYLRGFFFWLQNVAHEGAFKPWFEKSCLKMMPNNC